MSTTLNKLEYLDETKKEIKNALNTNFNSGITDEDTFRSYVGKINNIYTNWAKVTGEGTEITLNNTKKGKMALTPKGNTEQTTYTGKNLFYIAPQTLNGVTLSYDSDGAIVLNGTSNASYIGFQSTVSLNGTYNLSVSNPTIQSDTYVRTRNGNGTLVHTITLSDTDIKNTNKTSDIAKLEITIGARGITFNNFKIYVQLESGSMTSYEPYVGGTPSPNPDYPQDVRVVTGNNEIIVENKNLLSNKAISQTINSLVFTVNNDKSISVKGTASANTNFTILGDTSIAEEVLLLKANTTYYNATGARLVYRLVDGGYGAIDTGSFTPSNDISIRHIYLSFTSGASINATYYPMIELSNTVTTYEPYQSQTYPINLGTMELCKRPNTNYQDIIFHAINGDSFYDTLDNATKQTLTYGKWYKHSEIGKVVLDGSESWTKSTQANGLTYFYKLITGRATDNNVISNTFKNALTWSLQTNIDAINGSGNNTAINIMLSDVNINTLELFKTWLSTHNTEVYYVLATPTNEEITDTTLISQLNAIENAVSYDTQTNISSEYVENNAQMIISASALEKGGI